MHHTPHPLFGSLALLVAIYSAASLGCAGDSPKSIYDEAKKSTFVIETFDAKGIPLSLGTGFAVRSNYLASNCHVIRGAHRVTAKNLETERSFPVEAIVSSDLRADLVLLRIGEPAAPLVIDTNRGWSVGDSVYALGNPRGLEGTFSAGMISATREVDNVHYLQITAPISPGSSGGPILSSGGKVIGVATAAIKESQNLNFAVSAQHLAALLTAEPQEDTFDGFFAKQEDFARKQGPVRSASGGDIMIRNFEWTDTPFYSVDEVRPFTFSVFNGLSRPIRNVLVVVSFLNTDLELVDTKLIPIAEAIGPESALRAKGSVDASVAKLNLLPDPEHWNNNYKPMTYKIGTNLISVKWTGSDMRGHKTSRLINGKPATPDDRDRVFANARAAMRVMRVLSFEYAD
jgi:Trypsin-like peptidase domain